MKNKKVSQVIKLQLEAGKANPAPPVGTSLGPTGINIAMLCKQYNDMTKNQMGLVVPVEITIYNDRSFSLVLKTPPAAVLLRKAAGVSKGSGEPQKNKVGSVTLEQVKEIAASKMQDLTAASLDTAISMMKGTARSMGITVTE